MPTDDRETLRADAARNRERVAKAARAAFAELGADAPMAEIARRAGVGTATLYRRFPTRDALFELVFEDRVEACAEAVDRFLARSVTDPWDAFAGYLRSLFELQREDRAFTAALLRTFPADGRLEQERQRAMEGLAVIVERARDEGSLRTDFTTEDIELLLKAHDGVLSLGGPKSDSYRAADLLVDACRPPR